MLFQFIKKVADIIIAFADRLMQSKWAIAKAVLLCALLSVLSTTPRYKSFHFSSNDQGAELFVQDTGTCRNLARQIENPFIRIPFANGLHQDKMQFRLLVPLIGHFFHLSVNGLILLNQLFGFLIFYMILMIVLQITGDRTLAFLFTAGAAFIYIGKSAFLDLFPWFDAIPYFLLLFAMTKKYPVLTGLSIFLASWADERALIASGFVFLWWVILNNKDEYDKLRIRNFLLPGKHALSIIIAWICYFGIRFYLQKVFHFQSNSETLTGKDAAYHTRINFAHLGLFTGFVWYWLLIGGAAVLLLLRRSYLAFISIFGLLAISCAVALMVSDITRSVTYAFPAVIIAFYFIFNLRGDSNQVLFMNRIRYIILLVGILCLLTPPFNILGYVQFTLKPFFYMFGSI